MDNSGTVRTACVGWDTGEGEVTTCAEIFFFKKRKRLPRGIVIPIVFVVTDGACFLFFWCGGGVLGWKGWMCLCFGFAIFFLGVDLLLRLELVWYSSTAALVGFVWALGM